MKLFVGLGNPGEKYENTKHNIGFLVLDEIIKNYVFTDFHFDKKFDAFLSHGKIKNEDIVAIKPMTYMNLSGDSVIKVSNYYKIVSDDILTIHDDIDFDVGVVKLRCNTSSGGHRGVSDIKKKLGVVKFRRLRIGVGRPRLKEDVVDYVLSKLSKSDFRVIMDKIDDIINLVERFVEGKS